jgi:imidazolonepropionase-like amidohydrolase
MKKIFLSTIFLASMLVGKSQETVYPAKPQTGVIALTNATIHIGNGNVIENGTIVFNNGKIVEVSATASTSNAKIIDCKGKHIYPGLITPQTDLGLNEINSTRAMLDLRELGEINTNIRSAVAYNTDSKVIGTLRSNGILLANVIPQGGILSGSSSVMQLDAWNWEDAAYKLDNGIHFRVPNLSSRGGGRGGFRGAGAAGTDPIKEAMDRIDNVRKFFQEAKGYYAETKPEHTNLKFESVKGLFNEMDANPNVNWSVIKKILRPQQFFYVHAETVKEMQVGIELGKEFGFKTVIIGGTDSWKISDYLKENNVGVIIGEMHALPLTQDDDVDQPYKTPYLLQQAGVLFAISDTHGESRGMNLSFNAGTAAAYGLTKEQALTAITLNAAKVLGIDDVTGSLEKGKDANIIVSEGDILDMKTSNVTQAFIQGRDVSLDNKQKQLYERYKYKYGIK